jgi:hypothetical protein
MPTFLFTPPPWSPGKRNRRYGMTAGIFAQSNGQRIELGRMYIGSPEYEANFSLVLAAPLMFEALQWIAGQSDLFFAECSQAEEITDRARAALLAATTPHHPA